MKVLSVIWGSQLATPSVIGIITYENDFGDKTIVIGTGFGFSEQEDVKHIIEYGCNILPAQLEQTLAAVKS